MYTYTCICRSGLLIFPCNVKPFIVYACSQVNQYPTDSAPQGESGMFFVALYFQLYERHMPYKDTQLVQVFILEAKECSHCHIRGCGQGWNVWSTLF